MTTDHPTASGQLPPALPFPVMEHILATVPLAHKRNMAVTGPISYVPLLNVLSPRLVPTVLAAVIVDCLGPASSFSDDNLSRALKRLFGTPNLTEYSKFVLGYLRLALEQDVCSCRSKIVTAIATAGNLDLMVHVSETMELPDFEVDKYDSALPSAAKEGHTDILEWWHNEGYSLNALDHECILSAARNGHLSVLIWWSDLDPAFHQDFPDSALFLTLASRGHMAIMWWWKERFGLDRMVFNATHWLRASASGQHAVLEFAEANGFPYPDSLVACIDGAAANGHVHVLDWWYQVSQVSHSKCTFDYSVTALDKASANGHVQVLDFFAKSGLELRFTPAALHMARKNGHGKVVEWWLDCRLMRSLLSGSLPPSAQQRPPSDFTMLCAFGQVDLISRDMFCSLSSQAFQSGMEMACQYGQLGVLDLLHGFGHVHAASVVRNCMGRAVHHNQPAALQWCLKHFPQRSFPGRADLQLHDLRVAVENGYTEVLDVLLGAGLFKANSFHIIDACSTGMIRSLDFLSVVTPVGTWDRSLCDQAWACAAKVGHVQVLQWLLDHGVPLTPSDSKCIDGASAAGHWLVLEWWSVQELPFTFSPRALVDAVRNKHKRVTAWWVRSGRVSSKESLALLSNALANLEDY